MNVTPLPAFAVVAGDGAASAMARCAPVGWPVPILFCGVSGLQVTLAREKGLRLATTSARLAAVAAGELCLQAGSGRAAVIATLGGEGGGSFLCEVGRELRRRHRPAFLAASLPFTFEGTARMRIAMRTLAACGLPDRAVLPMQDLFRLPGDRTFAEAFALADRWLFDHACRPDLPADLLDYIQI